MTWTLTVRRADGSERSIAIRPPEFGDVISDDRQQGMARTDGGTRYTQDLGRSVVRYEATWRGLTACERRDMELFFGEEGTLRMARPFSIEVDDEEDPPIVISADLGLSADEGWSADDFATADGARWGTVYLDIPRLAFSHDTRDQRYGIALAFEIVDDGAPLT